VAPAAAGAEVAAAGAVVGLAAAAGGLVGAAAGGLAAGLEHAASTQTAEHVSRAARLRVAAKDRMSIMTPRKFSRSLL
jgi:hypothetical protein